MTTPETSETLWRLQRWTPGMAAAAKAAGIEAHPHDGLSDTETDVGLVVPASDLSEMLHAVHTALSPTLREGESLEVTSASSPSHSASVTDATPLLPQCES